LRWQPGEETYYSGLFGPQICLRCETARTECILPISVPDNAAYPV